VLGYVECDLMIVSLKKTRQVTDSHKSSNGFGKFSYEL